MERFFHFIGREAYENRICKSKFIRAEYYPARSDYERAWAEEVFIDKLSGKDTNRSELQKMIAFARNGDTVILLIQTQDR